MSEKQGIRISKVVKEFNIGIGTLTDFLKKKGIEVDPSPNSKISEEAYALVEKEFDKELQIKEQSRKIILKVKDVAQEDEGDETSGDLPKGRVFELRTRRRGYGNLILHRLSRCWSKSLSRGHAPFRLQKAQEV